jgi:hypothetical protein
LHVGPAPRLRMLSFGSLFAFNSAIPALTVFLLHPLILQTLAIPPCPNERASLAKNNRFCFSFSIGIIRFILSSIMLYILLVMYIIFYQ